MSFDKISESLDLANQVDLDLKTSILAIEAEDVGDVQSDYEFSRATYRSLIESGQNALENLRTVAGESDSPYAYQMISALIKSITDTTEKLMKLQKSRQELNASTSPSNSANPVNNTQNIFVGSTSELQAFLNKRDENV